MPLGTLDRSPPPIFKQGPSALSKLIFFSALALLLMVADSRFRLTQPLRATLATVLYPVQWLALQPVRGAQSLSDYFGGLKQAQNQTDQTRKKLARQLLRSGQVEQLSQENARLRELLDLRGKLTTPAMAAEVLYNGADPYTQKVILDKGTLRGVVAGSPVIDEYGVLGQVTMVYPLVSEVTLVSDRKLYIPVLNVRTGARSVVFGDQNGATDLLELRFMGSNADVLPGDLLTTSGVDGVYPAGLPVAKVERIERRADTSFARIYCKPQALVSGAHHVMVLQPLSAQLPERPPEPASPVKKSLKDEGGRRR